MLKLLFTFLYFYLFKTDSAEVLELHRKFRSLLDKNLLNVEVRSFIETTLTLMSLFYVRIVSVESAGNYT